MNCTSMGVLVSVVHPSSSVTRWLTAAGAALAATGLVAAGLLGPAAPADAAVPVDEIVPPPQEAAMHGAEVDLSGEVTIVAAEDIDTVALAALEELVTGVGGSPTVTDTAPDAGVAVHLGAGTTDVEAMLDVLGVEGTDTLPSEGYVLATGDVDGVRTLVLAGADARGTYYATQTLRQVVSDGVVPALRVRDYPLMPIRGAIEGFYGIPWSHEARLDLLEFSGAHKLNTYIYTPKDDLLLRAQWRELYEGEELERMAELVEQAGEHHVDFTFALSPANDMCYSSDEDYKATIAKFEQLRDLGVDSFYVALDDIPLTFHCDADRERYPNEGNWYWLADAQTDYLNRIQTEWIEPNGLQDLQTVPTNYAGSGEDPYKGRFGDRLDEDVRVQWTGEGVFSDTITVESVQRASQSYRTDHLYIWDNFPVNDGRRDRLFLNPLTGRDPYLYEHIDGFTSNPMIQPYASWPALANYADYTWNGPAYDAEASMAAVLRELAGSDATVREALTAFADLNQFWPYPADREGQERAPELSADIAAFWRAYEAGDDDGEEALADRLAVIGALPETLPQMAEPGFASDVEPWAAAAAQWATALERDVDMLAAVAERHGIPAAAAFLAAREQIELTDEATVDDQGEDGVLRPDVIVPTVGDGAFEQFDADAVAAFAEWLGVEPAPPVVGYPATATSSMGTYQDYAVDRMTDGDQESLYWSNETARTGDYVQVDLGEPREVGRVAVHQADSDNEGGDRFSDATLQYSLDGEEWTDIEDFTDTSVAVADLDEPVTARYVRLVANADNSGGAWVKVREFVVSAASPVETNLPSAEGAGVGRAFDGDLLTAYRAAGAPQEGAFASVVFPEPRPVGSVTVIGTGAGTIEVLAEGQWQAVGTLDADVAFHEAAVDLGTVEGVRLVFAAGSPAPLIHEVITREGGPVGEDPTEEPSEEPTEEPSEEPTAEQPTPTDPVTDPGEPTAPVGGPDQGGRLPTTGVAGADLLLTAGLVALLGGLLLTLAHRRRRA
ncbi:beta-N-acetylglucosaminidase domain-containing protein [Georgenia satyanarayanai]|uniref:beta-N-acetylglucosaminidase domain-containing protein n=1 Tax=Georgenia satyanarayanai TaxID=860221 RepID=UPI00203B3EE5|nr:beta-N-acetylglucosaminidase domain-containing protein [Georgenia satyanarayanai]MCM3661699.1 beta-N-acetylglucosaminidase domain-containing protein [Georgenia satyanarayanai]